MSAICSAVGFEPIWFMMTSSSFASMVPLPSRSKRAKTFCISCSCPLVSMLAYTLVALARLLSSGCGVSSYFFDGLPSGVKSWTLLSDEPPAPQQSISKQTAELRSDRRRAGRLLLVSHSLAVSA